MTLHKRNPYARVSAGVSLLALFIAACTPQVPALPDAVDTAIPGVATAVASLDVPPQAIMEAQQWLMEQLSVAAEQVQLIEVEQAEWTDSCLGLGQPDESCLQVITPGWRAVFEVNGQRIEVRTDETGSVIRQASP